MNKATLFGKAEIQEIDRMERSNHGTPRTPIEEALSQIWAEVLGLDEVDIYDDYFDLGGDSLMAMRIASRVIERFHVELSVRCLFRASTVAELAFVITQSRSRELAGEDINHLLTEVEVLSDAQARELALRE